MEMEMRRLLPQGKHLFNQRWGDLQSLTGKDKKLWLRVVKVARKCCKRSWVKEKSGGTFLQTTTKGSWGTQHRGASICEIQKSVINLGGTTQTQIDVVLVEQWSRDWIFIYNHYTLGVKWVSTCGAYYLEEARKVKDILLNCNHCVVFVMGQ